MSKLAAKKKKEKTKKVSAKVEKLVDEVSKLSVMELSQLVEALQDKLGVTATPVAATAPTATPAGEAASEEAAPAASANQTVTMTAAGDNKIAVIKALREVNQNWGLKEAKDMTESLPTEVLKDAKVEEAKAAADKLKAAGATVELK